MPTRETITMLRIPLLVLLVTLLVAAAAVFASLQYRQSQSVIFNSANASLIQARSKLQTTQSEEKSLQAYTKNYRQLAARGLFSEQKRLDWFENIKLLSQTHRLVALDYDLGPQRSQTSNTPSAPNIEILSSPLRMKIAAAHEEDLFHFLNALRTLPQGFYNIDNCDIRRSERDGANITADCAMEWMTLKAKKMRSNAS
jgi:autotransporter translocation and assembly factor TamB